MTENRESFRKNLASLVVDTIRFGVFFYPVYSVIQSAAQHKGFGETLTDAGTFGMTFGAMAGTFIYQAGKQIYKSYKSK